MKKRKKKLGYWERRHKMKYVLIPADVPLINWATKKPLLKSNEPGAEQEVVSMQVFVRDSVCNDQRIGRGGDMIRRIIRLEKAFEPANLTTKAGKKYAAVESGDYSTVMTIVNDLQWQSPLVGRQLVEMVEAWEKALDELPEEPKT